MKAIAINGSPRKGGNTETLLKAVLKPLDEAGWETSLVRIGGKKVRGCKACYKCFELKNDRCIMDKDLLNETLQAVLEADALILGSPTYFADVSAEMKAFIDRSGLVSIANGGRLAGKIGASVVAVRRGGATHVFDTMNHLFQISGMIIPGSTYWNMGYGLAPDDVCKDAEALRNMGHLGRMIAWLGEVVVKNKATMPGMPAVGEG
ncbi:MAG: flavodoxin family protein [Acidobacteriota bacterium]